MKTAQQDFIFNRTKLTINHHKKIMKRTEELDDSVTKLISKWSNIHISSLEDNRRLSNEIKDLVKKIVVGRNIIESKNI
ncbi:hypothetical protein HY745_10810 [Candidatus Desantisbacteria bacterium]|nr:hypothetical protein [Candidatus Desantisbacteria bacterium]